MERIDHNSRRWPGRPKPSRMFKKLHLMADRGYYSGEQLLACKNADITATLPKPETSNNRRKGRLVKADFRYVADHDLYICPASERLTYRFTTVEKGQSIRRYSSTAYRHCQIKHKCTTGKEPRITRWEHEHVIQEVQRRLDESPQTMRTRRETAEHPFGTIKARMGATHFLMKRLRIVKTEMALHVLAYNFTRVMNIIGIGPLMKVLAA